MGSETDVLKLSFVLAAAVIFASASSAEAFGYDSGDPLPNVTGLEIYDVSGLSTTDQRSEGELVHSGLNSTAVLNLTEALEYRFSFEITNEGASEWFINSTDEMLHRGVNSSWNLEDVYYNISSNLFFGGNLSDERVRWDTSQQGSLEVGNEMKAEYILEVPYVSSQYSQEFFVNDSQTGAGSRDYHRLETNKLGDIEVTLHEPPNNTVYQVNRTFDVNVTVECVEALCGDVETTPRYNTSEGMEVIPDTESEPFYITDKVSSGCANLSAGEKCRIQWLVNATGEEGSRYTVDVNSSSSTYGAIPEETGNDSLIGLNSFILMGLDWEKINFGYLNPGQEDEVAKCNDYSNCSYDIVIENYSVGVDNLWIKGSDLVSEQNPSYSIGIGNISYGLSNDISTEENITKAYSRVASDLEPGTVLTSFYWMDMPLGIVTGKYTGQITFKANNTG